MSYNPGVECPACQQMREWYEHEAPKNDKLLRENRRLREICYGAGITLPPELEVEVAHGRVAG